MDKRHGKAAIGRAFSAWRAAWAVLTAATGNCWSGRDELAVRALHEGLSPCQEETMRRALRLDAVRRLGLLTAIAIGLATAWGTEAQAEDCPPTHDLPVPHLPHTRAALATNQPILVVAIGSSSTRGWMATDVGHSYPALLQRYLNDHVPHISAAVINRGIGGQDAPEELARLDTDVLAIRPQLVIWQAGANGAVHDESPATFKKLMQEGITQLKAAGADVILMDNQRSPKVLSSADHVLLENAMKEVAAATGVNMFSRGGLMDQWAEAGAPNEDFIAADGMHMNNRGYSCLAETLGSTIAAALKQPITQQASGK